MRSVGTRLRGGGLGRGRDQPHLSVLDAMERGIRDGDRRLALFESVARGDDDPDVKDLLGKWARANPDEIPLALYRPGGVEFLFGVLEDAGAEPARRARWSSIARATGASFHACASSRDDPTPVPLRSVRAGGGVPTLGEIVRGTIRVLER